VFLVDTSTYHYKSRRAGQAGLEQRIKEICQTRVRYGYRRVHVLLRREGWSINQKKTRRVYRELGLQLRNKTPKRRVKAIVDTFSRFSPALEPRLSFRRTDVASTTMKNVRTGPSARRPRLCCSITMALPARHREQAGKL
jgi:putative transposase